MSQAAAHRERQCFRAKKPESSLQSGARFCFDFGDARRWRRRLVTHRLVAGGKGFGSGDQRGVLVCDGVATRRL